jgi:hypothetical protein
MFRVGQKVVLINDDWVKDDPRMVFGGYYVPYFPVKGPVYTVRDAGAFIRLVEIVNPIRNFRNGENEVCFNASRFRPAVERKTDIAIFQAMLNPSLEDMREIIRENANAS